MGRLQGDSKTGEGISPGPSASRMGRLQGDSKTGEGISSGPSAPLMGRLQGDSKTGESISSGLQNARGYFARIASRLPTTSDIACSRHLFAPPLRATSSHHLFAPPLRATSSRHLFTPPLRTSSSRHLFAPPLHATSSRHLFTPPLHTFSSQVSLVSFFNTVGKKNKTTGGMTVKGVAWDATLGGKLLDQMVRLPY